MNNLQTLNPLAKWWVFIVALSLLAVLAYYTGTAAVRTSPLSAGKIVGAEDFDADQWVVTGNPRSIFSGEATPVEFDGAGITLTLKEPGSLRVRLKKPLSLSSLIKQDMQFMHVSAQLERLSVAEFVQDVNIRPLFYAKSWKGGDVDFYGAVVRMNGLDSQTHLSRLIRVSVDASMLEVNFKIRTPGVWRISHLQVDAVAESEYYALMKLLLLVGAMLLAIYLLVRVVRALSCWQWLLLGGVVALAVWLAALPKRSMKQAILNLLDVLQVVFPSDWSFTEFEIQKLGHLLVFAVLSALLMYLRRRLQMTIGQAVALLLALAAFTEALQLHQLGRSPSFFDIGVDAVGIVCGVVLAGLISFVLKMLFQLRQGGVAD